MSTRCVICDLAWDLGISEQQFYEQYSIEERSQLYATYISRLDRATVRALFPPPQPKG